MKRTTHAIALSTMVFGATVAASADEVDVLASIKPVHSIVAAVMEGAGTPDLLIGGAASPHAYSLRPSEAAALEEAELVFWIGPDLEAFLERPIEAIARDGRAVALSQSDGLLLLDQREGGAFESHDHDDHGHDDHAHDEHDHDHDHDHEHDDHDHDDHAHDHDHEHGEHDAHLWLDPRNAAVMARAVAEALGEADPDNAALYSTNAETFANRLTALEDDIGARLAPVREGGFITFHDAYQYFEQRFGLASSGTITVNPDVAPGAERVSEIRARIAELEAGCVFAEPQFEPRIIEVVTEGTGAATGVLDPLGAELEPGPDLYFALLEGMAAAFTDCLGGAG